MTSLTRPLVVGVAAALCVAVLLAQAWGSLPYFPDDAYISLRYAQRLAEGHGLTWNDGERVEGYTNFLWVLLMAAPAKLRLDLVNAARAAGVLLLAASMAALFAAARPQRLRDVLAPAAGALSIALAAPVGAYALAGLEHPLSTALLMGAIVLADRLRDDEAPPLRRLLAPGLLLGLCSLARADAALLVAGVVFGVVAARGAGRAAILTGARLTAPAVAVFALGLAFRRVYYGAWVPNTFHAKVALTGTRLLHGLIYFSSSAARLVPLWVVLFAALAAARRDRALSVRLLPALVPLFLWCAYVVFIGGDNMSYGRHLVPAVVLSGWVVTHLVAWAGERSRALARAAIVAVPLLLGVLAASDYHGLLHPMKTHHWNWSGKPIGFFLKRAFGAQRPLIAVDAAGALPFYSELPTLDMGGLNDRWIATHPPARFGHGHIAHELGDPRYVLSRKPDIVVLSTPEGGTTSIFQASRELVHDPEFMQAYRLVDFRSGKLTWQHYLRVEGGPLGVRREEGRITVPGHLLATAGAFARMGKGNRVAVHLSPDHDGLLELSIPAGRWTARVEGDAAVQLTLYRGGIVFGQGAGEAVVNADGGKLTLAARVGAGEATVQAIVLTRS